MDRISVKALAEALVGLENGFWDDWRGPSDYGQPHKLTSGELSRLAAAVQNLRQNKVASAPSAY